MQNEMRNVKVIGQFFSAFGAQVEKRRQVKNAGKAGKENVEVVIEDAYTLYMGNDWFKSKIVKIGRPEPGQKVVVVYYKVAAAQVVSIENTKRIDMVKPVDKTIGLKFVKPEAKVSLGAAISKAILVELVTVNNTHIITRYSKRIQFTPAYRYGLAA